MYLFRAAKNNPQYGYGNRNEGMGPQTMGPTANNWGGGYGEMNTNMSSMMNTMNNMVRDNGVRLCVFLFVLAFVEHNASFTSVISSLICHVKSSFTGFKGLPLSTTFI